MELEQLKQYIEIEETFYELIRTITQRNHLFQYFWDYYWKSKQENYSRKRRGQQTHEMAPSSVCEKELLSLKRTQTSNDKIREPRGL